MGCTLKAATRVLTPIIVELAQGSKNKCIGIELNVLRCILEEIKPVSKIKVLV